MGEIKPITTTEKRGKAEAKKNTTIIAKCTCKSEYQDKLYGKYLRLKNSTHNGFRCTVCKK